MKGDVLEKISFYKKLLNQTVIKPKTYLHVEDCGFIASCKDAEKLAEVKPFSCGLTWNFLNSIAGGALASGGLTRFGKQVLKTFENAGIVIDLAHLNKESFCDVLTNSSGPIFCSHTAFCDVCQHKRNLDKEQIKALIERGGVIGLTFVGDFLSENGAAGFEDIFKHIHYFLENFDENHLCFGTDFYGTKNLPAGINDYKDFDRLYEYLVSNGIAKQTLNKIFYQNFNRFIKKNSECCFKWQGWKGRLVKKTIR